tara:strand:- start:788 stop:1228 length:441 start_codon:yes stop_codon:yes gene_type:complete
MELNAEDIIEGLKRRFKVQTDQGLAERLKLGRSTVTSWRRRNAVPERYAVMATDTPTLLPDLANPEFSDVERNAMILALVRLVRGYGANISDYTAFLSKGPFLPAQLAVGLEKALLDLNARMTDGELEDARQALNLIVFEELFPSK